MTKPEQRAYEAKRLVILAAVVAGILAREDSRHATGQQIAETAERITDAVMREEAKRTK